jgi:head-tail adaptor
MARLDRLITIFKITEDGNGIHTRHNLNKNIRASFRQLSDQERVFTHENGTDSTAKFEIDRRSLTTDLYVEYKRKTFGTTFYQISSIDPFDEHDLHIKLNCKVVEHALDYDKEVDG